MTAVLEKKKIKDYQTELEKMFEEEEDKVIKDSVKIPIEYYSKGFVRRDNNGSK